MALTRGMKAEARSLRTRLGLDVLAVKLMVARRATSEARLAYRIKV